MIILVFILGIISTLLGTGLLIHGLYLIAMALRSRQWPQAPATVSTCDIIATCIPGVPSKTSHHRAQIIYQYTVNGIAFTSSHFAFESKGIFDTVKEAQARVRRYLPGVQVTARYHPKHPAQSVLEPGIRRYTNDHARLGLAFLVLASVIETALWLSFYLR